MNATVRCNSLDFGGDLKVGQVVYLVREIRNGVESYAVRPIIPRKNMSLEPCENGWLGETNNVSRYAEGRVKITKITEQENGDWLVRTRKATP